MQEPGHLLTTPRLRLRPVTEADAEAIVTAINDYEVVRWLSRAPFPYTRADALAFIAKNTENAGQVWMIEDASGLVGCIGRKREFGYWLAHSAWGQGYGTEAGRAVLDWHFADPEAPGLLSGYHEGNGRSAHVLEKLGFVPCADRKIHALALDCDVTIKGMWMDRAEYDRAICGGRHD
ncbi:GNAT family N-acetyltransferase [Dinoroseobacter sp. S76]|uniref:GNAT family N-acetyltransferase n=1 Tax=Dinoroseobacter sp. S76 TaxID=3415124 RepID=UPI003C7BABF2